MADQIISNRVKKIVEENDSVRTLFLEKNIAGATPGQFAMLWIPRVDEKPFSFSHLGGETAFTVERKGGFTDAIFKLENGDYIGTRGPYGNGFSTKSGKKPCIIAGGLGMASLAPLAETLSKKKPLILLGAKTKSKLLFRERAEKISEVMCTTDDGSFGKKGLVTDVLREVIDSVGIVYGCGPEPMLKKVFEICSGSGKECQLSLERYMRCGIGICGSCSIDGLRVCIDGPVFSSVQLKKMSEFGASAKLRNGKKVELKEYFSWRDGAK